MEDDINRFLYGDDNEAVQEFQPKRKAELSATDNPLALDDDVQPVDGNDEQPEEEDDDEFEIVIDGGATSDEKRGLTTVSLGASQSQATQNQQQQQQQNPLDLGAIPLYPGTNTSLLDMDLEEAFPGVDKPWRRPGADMTDYFNFGFNEFTWRQYCTKQKVLREEFGATRKITMERHQIPHQMPPMPHQMPPMPHQMPPMPPMMPPMPMMPPPQQPPQPPYHQDRRDYQRDGNRDRGERNERGDRGDRGDRPRRSRSREPAYPDYRGDRGERDRERERDYNNRRPGRR